MKVLVVLSALVACGVATPTGAFSYSAVAPLGWGAHAYAAPLAYASPLAYGGLTHSVLAAPALRTVAAPAVLAAPAVVAAPAHVKTQYHAQDELGQASYGHTEPLQAHHAVQDAHGNKVGSFSYLNPTDGQVHRTDYVADALGYRVAANDLPAAPLVQPLPVLDTPEVAAAKAAHLAAHGRLRRSLVLAQTPAATAPLAHAVAVPVAAPLAYAAPLAHAAPLAYAASPLAYAAAPALTYAAAPAVAHGPLLRDAVLTTVVNNPGHAVSYRVD